MAIQKEQPYTKKATARILKEVLKVNPKASGRTTLDQAFVILMTEWDMELSIQTSGKETVCHLYRDSDKVKEWNFIDAWDYKVGDWDWDVIYKDVLETIIKEKLYKRPKLGKRAQKKLDEERAERLRKEEEETRKETQNSEDEKPKFNIQDLRKKRDNLSVKIWDWKKKGKDVSILEKELNEVKELIKKLK